MRPPRGYAKLSAVLRRARIDAGMTQRLLSDITGLSVRAISKIENARMDVGFPELVLLGWWFGYKVSFKVVPR